MSPHVFCRTHQTNHIALHSWKHSGAQGLDTWPFNFQDLLSMIRGAMIKDQHITLVSYCALTTLLLCTAFGRKWKKVIVDPFPAQCSVYCDRYLGSLNCIYFYPDWRIPNSNTFRHFSVIREKWKIFNIFSLSLVLNRDKRLHIAIHLEKRNQLELIILKLYNLWQFLKTLIVKCCKYY